MIIKSVFFLYNIPLLTHCQSIFSPLKFILISFNSSNNACVIGGGHYNQVGNKLLEKTDYCIGHIASKYYVEILDENLLKQMADGSNTDLFIFDWKSCGKGKHRVVELIEKLGYKWEKSKDLFNNTE